jgi:hypothetical protein
VAKKERRTPKPFTFEIPEDDPLHVMLEDDKGEGERGTGGEERLQETLSALEGALRAEQRKKSAAHARKGLAAASAAAKAELHEQEVAAAADPYARAVRLGHYRLVTRVADVQVAQAPRSEAAEFVRGRLFGRSVPRLPAHLVVARGAHAKHALGRARAKVRQLRYARLAAIGKAPMTSMATRAEKAPRRPTTPHK